MVYKGLWIPKIPLQNHLELQKMKINREVLLNLLKSTLCLSGSSIRLTSDYIHLTYTGGILNAKRQTTLGIVDCSVETHIDVEDFDLVLDFREPNLIGMLGEVDSSDVKMKVNDKTISVTTGPSKFKLRLLTSSDIFSKFDDSHIKWDKSMQFDGDELKLISKLVNHVDHHDSAVTLNNTLLSVSKGLLRVATTNGKVISIYTKDCGFDHVQISVPPDSWSSLIRLLDRGSGNVEICTDDKSNMFMRTTIGVIDCKMRVVTTENDVTIDQIDNLINESIKTSRSEFTCTVSDLKALLKRAKFTCGSDTIHVLGNKSLLFRSDGASNFEETLTPETLSGEFDFKVHLPYLDDCVKNLIQDMQVTIKLCERCIMVEQGNVRNLIALMIQR